MLHKSDLGYLLPVFIFLIDLKIPQKVPAEKQPRLFDDTSELEAILGEWSPRGLTLGRIVELLLPVIVHEALRATIRNLGDEKIDNSDLLQMVPTKVAIESSQFNTMSYQSIEQLTEIIEQIETFDSRFDVL